MTPREATRAVSVALGALGLGDVRLVGSHRLGNVLFTRVDLLSWTTDAGRQRRVDVLAELPDVEVVTPVGNRIMIQWRREDSSL